MSVETATQPMANPTGNTEAFTTENAGSSAVPTTHEATASEITPVDGATTTAVPATTATDVNGTHAAASSTPETREGVLGYKAPGLLK